jgi:HlyD family secretion protein
MWWPPLCSRSPAELPAVCHLQPLQVFDMTPPTSHVLNVSRVPAQASACHGGVSSVCAAVVATVALLAGGPAGAQQASADGKKPAQAAPKAALTVQVVSPQPASVPETLAVSGNVAPWQEAVVGSEVNGLRLAEVLVEVGQVVQKGQLLARFSDVTVKADLAQAEAGLAEAQAQLADAQANARRARELDGTGAVSAQSVQQSLTAELTARARVASLEAAVQGQRLRLVQTDVKAPDAGIISQRSATEGAVVGNGHELFRLIRGGRLEWRAEVPFADMARLRNGQKATVRLPGGGAVSGAVRKVAPTVDVATRNGLVYVDLPSRSDALRAGMYLRGEFRFDTKSALTLPASAVILRDGYDVVMRVDADSKTRETKVKVSARDGDRVALEGLLPDARVVLRGGAFLSDGDTVRVVQ